MKDAYCLHRRHALADLISLRCEVVEHLQIRQLLVILKATTKASMEAEQPEHGTARSPAAVFAAQVAALVSLTALSQGEGPAIPLGTARTALNQQLR